MKAATAAKTSGKSSKSGKKNPFNILFTCVGRRVVLLRAFRQALSDLGLTGKLIGTDVISSAPGMKVVDHAEIVPQAKTLNYIPRLQELVKKHKVRLLIPLTDLDLRSLSRHQEAFTELGCTVMVAPENVVAFCRNKIKFNNIVRKAGLKGIASCDIRSFKAKPFYPCFLKPVHGSAAQGAGKVRNESEFKAHVKIFGEQLMVQEAVAGQEYTIDVFRRRDGVVCAVVPRQRLSIRAGEVEKGVTVNDPTLIDAVLELVKQMPGAWGVINLQCRLPEDGVPRFFEANLRFGGGVPLALAAGVDLPGMVISEVLGNPPDPVVGEFTDKLLMLRYDEGIFTRVDDITKLPGYREPLVK